MARLRRWQRYPARAGARAYPRAGEWVQSVEAPGVPGARLCTLLTWVPGRRFGTRWTADRIRRVGTMMGWLHTRSGRFSPPAGFERPQLDAAGLMGRTPALKPGWSALTPEQRDLFERVGERLATAAGELGRGPITFGMLHGDFTLGNVLVGSGGHLSLIDFDDCAWGYYAYELAVLLDWLEARPDYPTLRAALLEGYRGARSFSATEEAHLGTFILARWVFLGLSFLSRPDHARFREYAPRFFQIVTPKIQSALGAGP